MDAPKVAPAEKPAPAQHELVRVALASGEGGPMVVAKKDAERLVKTGRWKDLGPGELPVLETKGRPGSSAFEAPPVVTPAPKESAPAVAPKVDPKAETKTASGGPPFGEEHED